ncbi:MAG: Crp/Fnr family transcriptional regulator [Bacteroidota bacterium]
MDLPSHIKSIANISSESEKEFSTAFKKKEYSKGESIFKQGEICKHIYFIESGLARMFYYSQSGKEVTAMFFKENSFFTAIDSFYNKKTTRDNCELLEDSVVYSLHINEMDNLLKKNHDFAKLAFHTTYEITRTIVDYTFALKFQTAKERYDSLLKDYPRIFKRVALIHIASFIGITPETLSRLRAKK